MGKLILNNGLIWKQDHFVPNTAVEIPVNGADRELYLEQEDLILPGILDFHMHLYSPATVSPFGVASENFFGQGIVGGIEAGSFGCANWEIANRYWSEHSKLALTSFLSILPEGLSVVPVVNPVRPEDLDEAQIIKTIQENKNSKLRGIKIQLGWLDYKSEETDRGLLQAARRIADATNTSIMVHISGTFLDIAEIVSLLKAGDIITHVYSGFERTILEHNQKVSSGLFEAQKKGVILDVGHAGKHFSWDVFKKAYAQGLEFDTLGTDITVKSWHDETVFKIYDIYRLIAGFLNLGIEKDKVFQAVTVTPARYLGYDLDLSRQCLILKKEKSDAVLLDGMGEAVRCEYEFRPYLFINEQAYVFDKERGGAVL